MIADDSGLRSYPIFCELFRQWRAARASAPMGSFQQPFRRSWEGLLEDAHLLSGEARREADRDARALAAVGLVELKTVRYRPYQIERIGVPLEAEPRLRALFADQLPKDNLRRFDAANVDWQPEVDFLRTLRTGIAADDLLKLNAFFGDRRSKRCLVPVKERSLGIFGDEKRLDALRTTILFSEGRLSLEQLCCFAVAEPLSWKRGPRDGGTVLVVENASTWDSYCRWNEEHSLYSAVVYGGGNRFVDSAVFLPDVFADVGENPPVLYFGDLDPAGVRIPQTASRRIQRRGLSAIEPDLWSYTKLLELGSDKATPMPDAEDIQPGELQWLDRLADDVRNIFDRGLRIAQEHLGWTQLSVIVPNDTLLNRQ